MLEKIHIFHTNDLHSHFEYWLRAQRYVKEQRQLYAKQGEPSFLIDLGDHVDRSNIYTEATMGKGNIAMLNESHYDVATIGNNEGITFAFEELYELYDEANFEVIVGNLQAKDGKNPAWLKTSTVLETANGTKIGIIAATAPFAAFYDVLGWTVTEPRDALMAQALALRPNVDILVCMSHLGITEDELLAQECPLLDVIFGSHTHHVLPEGKWIDGVLLTGGGKFGQYTGHLVVHYDTEQQKIIMLKDELIENAQLATDEEEAQLLYELSQQGVRLLDEPAVQLTKTYTKEWFHHSPLSKLFAEALFDYTGAHCALFNAGIFVEELRKGHVSKLDLHHVLPHPINLCVVELTGEQLMEVYELAQNEEWPPMQLKGLGFRGVVFGKLLFYKLRIVDGVFYVGEQPLQASENYQLVTLDLFTFGYFFPSFKYLKKHYLLPTFIRDVLLKYLEKTTN